MRQTITLFALALAGCANPSQSVADPAGYQQATFKSTSTKEVVKRLAGKCGQVGGQVQAQRDGYILCSRRLSDSDANLVGIPVESILFSKPENRMEFIARQTGDHVVVVVNQWAEVKSKSGDVTRTTLDHPKQRANMQKILASIGAA